MDTKELLEFTFQEAQNAHNLQYEPCHTPRNDNPDDSQILLWGRAWMTVLTLRDHIANAYPDDEHTIEEKLAAIAVADITEVLEAMYG